MQPSDIKNLKYSPMLVSEILYNFSLGSKRIDERGAKFELIYLVIPIVMDADFREKLQSMKITSTFKTAFLNKSEQLKDKLFFINEKVKHSKQVTNDGLVYLNSVCSVTVGDYFSVHGGYGEPSSKEGEYTSNGRELATEFEIECFKAAYSLGSIFAKEGYVNVFLKTKVNNI
ncbi:three component ABC system middle component [Vibrio cyclitrophicus]